MSVFKVLDKDLRKIIKEKGFDHATLPQQEAIPEIIKGKNVLLISPTGSGKTEAIVLPVLNKIRDMDKGISALYITPLRALNRDMLHRLKWWGDKLDIDVQVRHGDTSKTQRRKQSQNPPDFLITTPETVQAILPGSRMRKHLSNTNHVIVDEIHDISDSKRGTQLCIALERLSEIAGGFQRLGLSATIGNPKEVSNFLVGKQDCSIIDSDSSKSFKFSIESPNPNKETYKIQKKTMLNKKMAAQVSRILNLISTHESTLIFVNTRELAEILASRFNLLNVDVGVHHGSISKNDRINAEKRFKNGELDALICTSSMELGIDIGRIDLVIQFNSPRQVFRMLQRIGRSGHLVGQESKGLVIASNPDEILESASIIHKGKEGELENINIRKKCYDVLSNQICGICLERDDMDIEKLHSILEKSYPYENLSKEELQDVLNQMHNHGLIYLDEDRISRRKRTWKYYYSNLSMIPDERNYTVKDMNSGKSLATLDESFVATFAKEGEIFITQGKMWRIVTIEDDEIKVEEVKDPQGTVPNWIGEEIPVPFKIAQDVGNLRKRIRKSITDKKENTDILNRYHLRDSAKNELIEYIDEQINAGFTVPTDDDILVEIGEKEIIVNSCFGHRTNKTLNQALIALLTSRLGSSIATDTGPYRIRFKLPENVSIKTFKEIFEIEPSHLEPILKMSVKNTPMFKWELVKVAKKFGIMDKDADYNSYDIDNLLDIYDGTPVYKEAMNELLGYKLDISSGKDVLKKLKSGDIEVTYIKKTTPIGTSGFDGPHNLVSPDRADDSILRALKKRIMNDHILLFCIHCKDWSIKMKIKRVGEEPKCPKCDSKMIAALNPWDRDKIKKFKKGIRGKDHKNILKSANMVLTHGKDAVIALAGRGIGPRAASRVLKSLPDEKKLYKKMMEEERKYARTHMFWD